jgi:replicative DNA helicase
MAPGGRLIEARSDKVWPVGVRAVFEVTLASGRSIRCTAEHRLFGADGWVRVKDLGVGDRLAIARRLPEPARTVEWPDDRVALLGQLIGDGSYLFGKPLRYTTASEENSELVSRAARALGAKVSRIRGRGRWHQLFIGGNGNRWHPAGVNAWLRELGIYGQRSHQKRLPPEAFQLRNEQVAILLRHLWATDGCIHARKPGTKGSHTVYFSTSSRGLVDDVAALLLRFGIVGRIKKAEQEGYRPWWHLYVSGAVDQRWFLRQIEAFGPRVAQAARLAAALDGVVPNTNVDTLPAEVFRRVRATMRHQGIRTREMAEFRGTANSGESQFAFAPSRWVVAEYAAILGDDELEAASASDLFWDRVSDVHSIGSELVFDITVPGPFSWTAGSGSVISHNSGAIEQDSDVVMFIHRDDADPEKKRQTELIIAKHRNGPTGNIRLDFEPSLTQFRNAARDAPQ